MTELPTAVIDVLQSVTERWMKPVVVKDYLITKSRDEPLLAQIEQATGEMLGADRIFLFKGVVGPIQDRRYRRVVSRGETHYLEQNQKGHSLRDIVPHGSQRINDDAGVCLAWVYRNTVILEPDLFLYWGASSLQTLVHVLSEAGPLLSFNDFEEEIHELPEEAFATLSDFFDNTISTAVLRFEEENVRKLEELRGYQDLIAEIASEVAGNNIILEGLRGRDREEKIAEGVKELQECLADGLCDQISMDGPLIQFLTQSISIGDVELGRYIITLHGNGAIRIFAERKFTCGYQHPHIDQHGVPCWGNITREAIIHGREMKFKRFLGIVNDYLCSYNPAPGGAYRRIHEFVTEN